MISPAIGYSCHTLALARAPFHPPSSCQSECPQTEPSHITSLAGPCLLFPGVFWVKFNFLVHLVKRALPHLSSDDPVLRTTLCPHHHLPQYTQNLTPTKALRPKPRPLGHSLASFPEGSSPADHPSFSSTHLGDFPVPLIPKQMLGKDGRKLTVPVPTSGRRGKSTIVPSRCQALSCVLYRSILISPEQGSESIIIPITQTGKLMFGETWGFSNGQTVKEGQALTLPSPLWCTSMFLTTGSQHRLCWGCFILGQVSSAVKEHHYTRHVWGKQNGFQTGSV